MSWPIALLALGGLGLLNLLPLFMGILFNKGLSYVLWLFIWIFAPLEDRPVVGNEDLPAWGPPLLLASTLSLLVGLIWIIWLMWRSRRQPPAQAQDNW